MVYALSEINVILHIGERLYSLPSSLTGTVTIRVLDTDRTAGNRPLDTVHIDHMFIRGE